MSDQKRELPDAIEKALMALRLEVAGGIVDGLRAIIVAEIESLEAESRRLTGVNNAIHDRYGLHKEEMDALLPEGVGVAEHLINLTEALEKYRNESLWVKYERDGELTYSIFIGNEAGEEDGVMCDGWRLAKATLEGVTAKAKTIEEKLIYIPGDWICPTCNYRKHQRLLHAQSGLIGVSLATPDPCPNDGTPLQRLTWKQDAEDANRVALDLVKENRKLREGK